MKNPGLEALRSPEANPSDRFTIQDLVDISGLLFTLSIDQTTMQPSSVYKGLEIELVHTQEKITPSGWGGYQYPEVNLSLKDTATGAALSMCFHGRDMNRAIACPVPNGRIELSDGKDHDLFFYGLDSHEATDYGLLKIRNGAASIDIARGSWHSTTDLRDFEGVLDMGCVRGLSEGFAAILEHFPVEEIRQLAYANQLNQLATDETAA